ncbi:MAG: hypothetical protein V4648_05750 [Bacteroidota bacterium]
MKYKIPFIALSFLFFLPGCSNNSSDDLIDINPNQVKYSVQIKNIIETNCIFCHQDPPVNGAPMRLTTYDDVKNAVLNRGLIDRISRPQGAPGMMPNGGNRLPQALIDQIIAWQNEGFAQ